MKMRKVIYILFLLLFFLPAMQAQKRYIYQDSALLQTEPPVPSDSESYTNDNAGEKTTGFTPTDMVMDTTLYINNLQLSPDSIQNWKKLKQYAYIKNLDSLLEAKNKKKELDAPMPPAAPNIVNRFFNSTFL